MANGNNLFGRLSRAINNPVVQNVLGAGAVAAGAGPLFGLLSIPAFQSERRKAENQELTNEDLRLSIMSRRRHADALDRLPGLVGPDPTNPAIENFGAPGEKVPGFTPANPERAAQRQDELTSTLLQLAGPQGAATILQNMFPQQRTNAFAQKLATAQAALQANDPDATLTNEQILQMAGATTPIEYETAIAQLNLSAARQRELNLEYEQKLREMNEGRDVEGVRFGAMLRDGKELFQTLSSLKGSPAEPGGLLATTFGPGALSAGATFFDLTGNQILASDFRTDQENFNRFEKAASRFTGALATQLANAGVAQNSQTIANVRAASPNRDITIRANLAAMKSALIEAQEVLSTKGISVPEEYWGFIDELESLTPVRQRQGEDFSLTGEATDTAESAFDTLSRVADQVGKSTTELLRDVKEGGMQALQSLNVSAPDMQTIQQWLQGVQADALPAAQEFAGQTADAVRGAVDAAPGVAQDLAAQAADLGQRGVDAAQQGMQELAQQTQRLTAPRFQSQDSADEAFRNGEIEDGAGIWINGQFGIYEADFTDQMFRQANQFRRSIGSGLEDTFGDIF